MKLKKEIKNIKYEFTRRKLITGAMFLSLIIGVLSFIKPNYTQSIAIYIGLSILNLGILAIAIFLVYWFYIRRRLR